MKMKMKRWITGFMSMTMVILFPCLFLYFHNMSEGHLKEILPAVGCFFILMFAFFTISVVYTRKFDSAVVITEAALLFFMNCNSIYTFVHKVLPELKRVYMLCIASVLLCIFAIWVKKKLHYAKEIYKIVGFTFGILIVMNLIFAVPDIIARTQQERAEVNNQISEVKFVSKDKPNVYYMIFDEYGGFENLDRYMDFDNHEFENFLIEEGFNISYSSRNQESLYTYVIVPNLLNLSYVVDNSMDTTEGWEMTKNAQLFQLFLNNGYQINMINHQGWLGDEGCNVLNYVSDEKTLSSYILENSIWLQYNEMTEWIKVKYYGEEPTAYNIVLKNALELLTNCEEYVSWYKPTFTIAYFVCPHDYFVFDQEGNFIPDEQGTNYANKDNYINQLIYVNQVIENTVTNIKEKDPDAVIIIQSDHGMRYPHMMDYHYGNYEYDPAIENPYMQNILNCVYYKGNAMDIEGMSGVNTLRMVLNEAFGTDYELLDAPEEYVGQ